MGLVTKLLDWIFFFYFLSHIPITIFVDSQAVIPKEFYPQPCQDMISWYCRSFKDPMMVEPPGWFKSFCVCELIFQLPFFFPAVYAFWKGSAKCKWIRIPAMVYGAHVTTTVIPIITHILFHDFSTSKHPGPESMDERLQLTAIYFPYLLIPILILLHTLFNGVFREDQSIRIKQKKVK